MAMRGRGGRVNPNRPPRLITGRVYEQFKPMSEWRQEDDYDTLLLYLPGFQKEYIKVTTEGLNIVRVRGERWIAENKWSRFQEDYRVPENCKMGGIRAKFDSGILTIIMPREINNAPPSPPPLTTTQLPPKINEQPFGKTKQEELPEQKEETKEKKPDKPQTTPSDDYTLPPPPSTTTTSTDTQLLPKTKEQPFKSTKQEESLPEPKEESEEKKPDKPQSTPLKGYTLPPPPKPTSSSTSTKLEPLKPSPKEKESIPKYALKQDKHYVDEKPNVGEKKDLDKRKETLLERETNWELEGTKGTLNYTGVASGGFQHIEPKDNKKVVARRWMLNEDRKALVNVGVGVLVIVALGVHVSYNIGLISKGK